MYGTEVRRVIARRRYLRLPSFTAASAPRTCFVSILFHPFYLWYRGFGCAGLRGFPDHLLWLVSVGYGFDARLTCPEQKARRSFYGLLTDLLVPKF